MLLVEGTHEIAHLGTEDAFHRPFLGRHDVDFQAAGAQRGGDLQADEARADHHGPLGGFGPLDDGATVGQRTQRVQP